MPDRTAADALVLFGATGDLAHKQIWPALHAMARRGALTVPVVGVAFSKWDRDKALDYARTAVKDSGGSIGDDAWKRIEDSFQYVDGDYRDTKTFEALAQALGDAKSPMHYLAIPPSLFGTVVQALGAAGLADDGRVVIEKPFGHDLETSSSPCGTATTSRRCRSRWPRTSASPIAGASTTRRARSAT